DTALHAVADGSCLVLEPAQGFQLAFIDHNVVAQDTDRLVPVDRTFDHHASGNLAKFRRVEDITHFRHTKDLFAHFWREHAAQDRLHVIYHVIDDVVVTQFKS